MNKKIITAVVSGIVIIIAIIAGGSVWFSGKNNSGNIAQPRACTEEAKVCPDGSAVGRTGPNCEFAECPKASDCAKEGESIGAVALGIVPKKCCDGLAPIVPQNIVGTQGICQKINDKITVTAPSANTEISSPVTVAGQARGGWFFEGSFPVEIYDSNNKLLGSGTGKFAPQNANDTWMTNEFVNFQGEIKFSQSTTASGYLLFKKDNPSGNPSMDESFKVGIKFKQVDATDAWKTYKNDKYGFTLTFPETWKGYTAVSRELDWGSDGKSDSIDFGFPAQKDGLFNISFYSEKQYNSIVNSGVPFGMLLGKNADYVFVWNQTQYAANKDMEKRITEIQSIIKTFKLIK